VQHFDHVIPDMTGRWNRQPARPVRRYRGDPAGPPVVVQEVEGHLQAAVADALYVNRDRGTDRSTPRRDLDRHVDRIGDLRHQTIALLQHDVMVEAEVLGCLERGLQASGGVTADARHLVGHRHELAPFVLGFGDVPPPDHRAPDHLEFLVGRQIGGCNGERVSCFTVERRDTHCADIPVSWLAYFYLRPKTRRQLLGGSRRGEDYGEKKDEGWSAHRQVQTDVTGRRRSS
jgi:hypothetical protein